MKLRSWTTTRAVVAMLAIAIGIVPFNARAAITGGLANGYTDTFDYPNVTPTNSVPVDASKWQTFPLASNGQPVPNIWKVGTVQTSTIGGPDSQIKALKQESTGAGAGEPVAYVRGGNWRNVVVETRAAFVGNSQNSGIGLLFRSPVDPLSGLADRNNYYLFTAVQKTPNPKDCFTGRCYFLIKRVGGAFFLGGMAHTYLNFVNPSGPPESHVYKVVMSGERILCYVDGQLVLEVVDTPGDDVNGDLFRMPGPMFSEGTVGVRSSNTRAWFDDFTVMADSPRAYEGRAAAMSTYGQVGLGQNGIVARQTGADTAFQYYDHDFPTGPAGSNTVVAPVSPGNGVTGGSLVTTSGKDGVARSTAQLFGFSGTMTHALPNGGTVDVSVASDTISATATASCEATSSSVQLANFTYLIVVKNAQGIPIVSEGKSTHANPPPNTEVADPSTNGGYVRITLNSQKVTTDPRRADVSAIRIDFLSSPLAVETSNPNGTTNRFADTGITTATVHLANVVAGRLCPTVI